MLPRRLIAVLVIVLGSVAGLAAFAAARQVSVPAPTSLAAAMPPLTTTSVTASTITTTSTSITTTTIPPPPEPKADERLLTEVGRIGGDISPKSVVASPGGLVFAQNMMYRHTVTVYDRDLTLVATIPDAVDLTGFDGFANGEYRGAPVEAAASSDGAFVYVSNYEMTGPGLAGGASDDCGKGIWPDSFVYRIDAIDLSIDQVIRVGSVPKFLTLAPDGSRLVVSNWCSFDVSLVDTRSATEVARVDVGRHPRGIAVSPDGSTAYVAVMGAADLAVVDLATAAVVDRIPVGATPRHVVVSPDGNTLYVSLNSRGVLAALDVPSRRVLATISTGSAPRSMALSDDGTALYVANYESDTLSKVRTADMSVIQEVPTGLRPIGVTYDAATRRVWVANYSGTIQVFEDRTP